MTRKVERRISKMAENLKRLERGEPLQCVAFTGIWTPRVMEVLP